jgi:O-antigen/teichoic acid export membrane protein
VNIMTTDAGATSPTDAAGSRTSEATGVPSIGRASAVLTGATLAASGVNYALNLLLARWMTPRDFGDANLIVTLMLGLTAVAVTLQLITAQRVSTSRAAEQIAHRRSLLRRAWIVGVTVAAVIAASSPLVRDVTSSASALPFVLLALGLPFYLAQAVERGVLQGRLRFGDLAATLVIEAVTRLGVAIALVAAGFGVSGATAGITASFVSSWWLARRRVSACGLQLRHCGDHSDTRVLRTLTNRSATHATILLLIGQILINNGDVVLAKTLFDADVAGVYSVVALIGRAIFFLSWSVVTAAFPMAAQADVDERRLLQKRAVRTVAAMSALMTLGVAILAPPLTPLFFGADYAPAAGLFLPYAIATSLFAVANVMASLGAAQGRRGPALVIIGGAVVQTALLISFASDPNRMVWLQVLSMGLLLAASFVASRPPRVERPPLPRLACSR